jgi:hypothetical protein
MGLDPAVAWITPPDVEGLLPKARCNTTLSRPDIFDGSHCELREYTLWRCSIKGAYTDIKKTE